MCAEEILDVHLRFDAVAQLVEVVGIRDGFNGLMFPEHYREGNGAFEFDRQIAKIGKPVDRGEWGMTPPTVNAYYDASLNEMVLLAGILVVLALYAAVVGIVAVHRLAFGMWGLGLFAFVGLSFDYRAGAPALRKALRSLAAISYRVRSPSVPRPARWRARTSDRRPPRPRRA